MYLSAITCLSQNELDRTLKHDQWCFKHQMYNELWYCIVHIAKKEYRSLNLSNHHISELPEFLRFYLNGGTKLAFITSPMVCSTLDIDIYQPEETANWVIIKLFSLKHQHALLNKYLHCFLDNLKKQCHLRAPKSNCCGLFSPPAPLYKDACASFYSLVKFPMNRRIHRFCHAPFVLMANYKYFTQTKAKYRNTL